MTFLFPLGLLGLIGVPVLILIYILKNRYTEQTVSATYLWRLSERFIKRRNPLSRITGIISLILQILLVVAISLAIAHPKIILKGAANEYCFVLDGSGSMSMEKDGVTRLDTAKSEINKIIDGAEEGSLFTLVYVTDITETVFEIERDRAIIKERIASLECSDGNIDYTDSIGVAQRLFEENPALLTYLLTDEDYAEENRKNVNVVNVAKDESNISISGLSYISNGGNSYTVSGKAVSYGANRETVIEVRNNMEERVLASLTISLTANTETEFSIDLESDDFYSLTVTSTAEDAMSADNSEKVYNIKSENAYDVLLVSDKPYRFETVIDSVSHANVTVISHEDYKTREAEFAASDKTFSGYGLYIYEGYSPKALPTDGTLWFVGLTENVSGAGFSIQGNVALEADDEKWIDLNKSSNTFIRKLTNGLNGEKIAISQYTKCGVYGNFNTIYSYMGNPVLFTGESDSGNRTVVFSFGLSDSNFTVTPDFPILLYNLLTYSFPEVIEKTEYTCGEKAYINVIPGTTGIRVSAPSGSSFYADASSAVSEFALNEAGEYKITLELGDSEREFYIFSAVPTDERNPVGAEDGIYSIRGEAAGGGRDGEFDPIVIILVLTALLFAAEWMVYCYEKYQLR